MTVAMGQMAPMDPLDHAPGEYLSFVVSLLLFLVGVVAATGLLQALHARRAAPRFTRGTSGWRPAAVFASLAASLPEGRLLAESVWARRHRMIVELAFVQAVALGGYAIVRGDSLLMALAATTVVAIPALPALVSRLPRKIRAVSATTSLIFASVALVHLSNGITEAHFHFFVMVGVVSLYQDWAPYGAALIITLVHHGLMGTLDPQMVYGSSAAQDNPWMWALLHGGFVLALSLALLGNWRLNEQQGLHDPLTGLPNRILLKERLSRSLTDPDRQVSVLFIDLDDFKAINDSHGHTEGDELLCTVARQLKACTRPGDVVARFGGDEFALLVEGSPATSRATAERVLAAFVPAVTVGGTQLTLRASIGVADTATLEERTAGALIRNADLAMYLAKAGGKGRWAPFAEGMQHAARGRAMLAQDLAAALDKGELDVYYQQTVLLADETPYGVEALVRWHHPTKGEVSPVRFIPLAESTGLIGPIGTWVLRTAISAMASLVCSNGDPATLAVNVSPRQLVDDDLVTIVTDALASSGMAADRLVLEITEGALVTDIQRVALRLVKLRSLGVRIAVDDFGTGYSGLSYLRQLPIDIVKIDRSFVDDMNRDQQALMLVRSVVELAHSLGVTVVAEGIETEAQAQLLREMRCSRAQGYLYARPVPLRELTGFRVTSKAGDVPLARGPGASRSTAHPG